jgi:FkbM family methyltransferase
MAIREVSLLNRGDMEERFRNLCMVVALTPEKVLARVLGEFKMLLDLRDSDVTPCLMMDGFWEMWLTRFLCRTVKDGWCCVDIGAHYGYYSLLLGQLVGAAGQVHAFEPFPDTFDILIQNLRYNGMLDIVVPHAVGCSDLTGYVDAHFLHQHSGATSLLNALDVHLADQLVQRVKVVTLDRAFDALANKPTKINLIKIDTEGMEAMVWDGMAQLRATNPGMLVVAEYHPKQFETMQRMLSQAAKEGWNFGMLNYEGKANVSVPISKIIDDKYKNFVLYGPDFRW